MASKEKTTASASNDDAEYAVFLQILSKENNQLLLPRSSATEDTESEILSVKRDTKEDRNSLFDNAPQCFSLEQLETGEKTHAKLAEHTTSGCPRHAIGCTKYECHGSLMEKKGFCKVNDSDAPSLKMKLEDADAFLTQFANEDDSAYANIEGGLVKRLEQVKKELETLGTYTYTFEELQFGCRVA
jgi:hypothetical protein